MKLSCVLLQGGFKIIVKLLRTCLADGSVIAMVGRVLSKCLATSTLNQQTLAKEKVRLHHFQFETIDRTEYSAAAVSIHEV